jgi:hypothetical protein
VKGVTHPFTRALYEQDGLGRVRITQTDGRVGLYAVDGRWLEGDKLDVDPHLVGWVGGPKVQHHRLANPDEH